MRKSRSITIESSDIWPGFTDALAGILLVLIFLISMFVVTEYLLSSNLSGRDATIMRLNEQISQLEDQLGTKTKLTDRLWAALLMNKEQMESLRKNLSSVQDRKRSLEEQQKTMALAMKRKTSEGDRLLQRITALRQELENLNRMLEESRIQQAETEQEKSLLKTQAASLSQRLNLLLAERVKLLNTYRSDFFGKMREIIGENNPYIRIIGDRFIMQSEVLFSSGAASLSTTGKKQMLRISKLLRQLSQRIPKDVPWVIQVAGHTDDVPINTSEFPSNWELSSARALNVVRYLIDYGKIAPQHLIATGFGEFHPLNRGKSEKARSENRRIELKITSP